MMKSSRMARATFVNFMGYGYISLTFLFSSWMDVPSVEAEISRQAIHRDIGLSIGFVIAVNVVVIAVLILLYFKYNRIKQAGAKLLRRSQKRIEDNQKRLEMQQEETRLLQLKVNEAFGEVVQLAKTDSEEFFTRFNEVYPEVVEEILKRSPKLRISELTLLAYVFLGFKTKDIALYTFKSVNTVRNRKHNLRKKLGIPTEESMELWLKDLQKKE